MTAKKDPPFRAEHIGSLLRPPELLGARRAFDEGKIAVEALHLDVFFLEYDSPRAGSFAPLKPVPREKVVVLGLVNTKSPVLESADELRRRIDEASRLVPLDRLALSPQCGFASTAPGNPITPADQERKLRLVVEVANKTWG